MTMTFRIKNRKSYVLRLKVLDLSWDRYPSFVNEVLILLLMRAVPVIGISVVLNTNTA